MSKRTVHSTNEDMEREKTQVALSSVIAALFLTTLKIVTGLLTGSLGILSEAAHSGLDFAAAGVTWFAVRVSAKPPDREHTYGHGKVENLSALFETILLLITCVWIFYEAIQRLFFKSVEIEASIWAFLVMAISIVVDISRSRALYRVAKKYRSQALEADALHFSTDVWSSTVVIAGLGFVRLADIIGIPWLVKADAIAAMAVAGIVVYVSAKLGMRTIAALLDAIPAGLQDEVAYAAKVSGVLEVKQTRVRVSGPETFADVTLVVSNETTLDSAHQIADLAEGAISKILPEADVVVHVEPATGEDQDVASIIRQAAATHGMNPHGMRIYDVADKRLLEMHLEVSPSFSVEEAHAKVSAFENDLRQDLPGIHQIVTHIEPKDEVVEHQRVTSADENAIIRVLEGINDALELDCRFHQVEVYRLEEQLLLSFHCTVDPDTPIVDAHALTEIIENQVRIKLPQVDRVTIHVEPTEINQSQA